MSAALDNLELIPDPQLAKKLGVSLRTIARWDADPKMGLPATVVFSRRKYRRVAKIEAWLSQRALASIGDQGKRQA